MKYQVCFSNNNECTRTGFDSFDEAKQYAKHVTKVNDFHALIWSQNNVCIMRIENGVVTNKYKHKNGARGIIERKKR